MKSVLPILTVIAAILLFWVVCVVPMNIHLVADQAQRDELIVTPETPSARQDVSGVGLALRNTHLIPLTYNFVRPNLPSPHQVAGEMYNTIFGQKITSKRSLVYHGWVTLAPTLLGFLIKFHPLAVFPWLNRGLQNAVINYCTRGGGANGISLRRK